MLHVVERHLGPLRGEALGPVTRQLGAVAVDGREAGQGLGHVPGGHVDDVGDDRLGPVLGEDSGHDGVDVATTRCRDIAVALLALGGSRDQRVEATQEVAGDVLSHHIACRCARR